MKLKYEDYVKDREDVYAKVKRVLEEVDDEAESQSECLASKSRLFLKCNCSHTEKKKEEKLSEPAGIPSDTVKNVSSASLVPPQVTNTVTTSAPVQSVEVTTTKPPLLAISTTVSACSTTALPPNVVISSTLNQIMPKAIPSSGQQPSVVLPVPALAKVTSKTTEANTSSNNLTIPTIPLQAISTTSQSFSFTLPNVQSTTSTSNSQVKQQPTLNFSMPLPTASKITPSSGSGLSVSSSLVTGTALGVPSSMGTGIGLLSSSGAGFKLQLPTTTTTTATTSTVNALQLQTNLLQSSKYCVIGV